jgi:aryl-alcohol dehydrogenase-like predicted oxidoreductase
MPQIVCVKKEASFMETRRLGQTDLHLTTVGFGAWAIGGGGWVFGWGPQDDADSMAAIQRAVALGINWIDTAAVYGLGRSEAVVARALRDIPRAERPYVFTKCSLVWDEDRNVRHTLRGESIRRECEESLRRLETDRIDLYQIHWPRWAGEAAAAEGSVEEAWSTLADLQREGKVRHIGVSNFDADEVARAEAIAPVASLQPPYSVLRRDIEDRVLPYCREHRIGVIVYSPMQSGLLSGRMTRERIAKLPEDDWRRKATYFNEPHLTRALRVADVLGDIGARQGKTAGHVAIAWTLRHPAVTAAIVGARTPQQVEELADAGSVTLGEEDVARIERAL